MKKWVMAVSALVMAAGLAGCSSDYVMATKDGNMILTQGKPEARCWQDISQSRRFRLTLV